MLIHAEWGLEGIRHRSPQTTIIVIVDVLSFTTCVDVAVSRGASVLPFAYGDQAAADAAASAADAIAARRRSKGPGALNLSPASLMRLAAGTRVLLPSPNGSRLSLAAAETGCTVIAGCLRNATAVATATLAAAGDGVVLLIAAGERWPDDKLRPAIEDLLGVGAILTAMDRTDAQMTVEARVMRRTFQASSGTLCEDLRSSISGRELIDRGFPEDVEMAADFDCSRVVPVLIDGAYQTAPRSDPKH